MKLLFDENLSPRLVERLSDLHPGSQHVRAAKLSGASDQAVWDFAAKHGFTIVSKDNDFHQRSFLLGHPPKVIWLVQGNCSTSDIETILRTRRPIIEAFLKDPLAAFLALE